MLLVLAVHERNNLIDVVLVVMNLTTKVCIRDYPQFIVCVVLGLVMMCALVKDMGL